MCEVAQTNNIKYFGAHKVDSRLIASAQDSKKSATFAKQRDGIIVEISKYQGKIRKYEQMRDSAKMNSMAPLDSHAQCAREWKRRTEPLGTAPTLSTH